MPIKRRGNSWQSVFYFNKERYQKTSKDYAVVEAWELETLLALKRGEPVKSAKEIKKEGKVKELSWSQLRQMLIEQRWSTQKSSVTHELNSKGVIELLGRDKAVAETTQKDIDKLVVDLKNYKTKHGKEGSNSTVNRKLSSLSVMTKYALKRGYIKEMFEIPKLREAEHRIRWISDKEENQLLTFFEKLGVPDLTDIVPLLIDTGLRLGELWRLTGRDARAKSLTVWESKGHKARSVPLTRRAQAICNRRRETLASEADQFFPGWTNWRLTHYWNLARESMGLTDDPQFVPHICRHTFCSRLIQRGVSPVHVKELAGHSVITTTMRYAHLSQEDLERAITVLDGPGTVVYLDRNQVGQSRATSDEQQLAEASMG